MMIYNTYEVKMIRNHNIQTLGGFLPAAIFFVGFFLIVQTVFSAGSTQDLSSLVTIGNSAPTVSAVTINGGNDIVLTPNATTTVYVNFTVQDANGCNDVFINGNVTSSIFRTGVGAACTADNRNCYIVSTSTHNCTSNASTTQATTTFFVYYFADSTTNTTTASSSFPADHWTGFAWAKDASLASSTQTSTTAVELGVLTALNVTTSSINYGTLSAGQDTGAVNQNATATNAGNSTTTLRLHASSTLVSGSNSIPTSSQVYSTSSFIYAGTSTPLTASAVTVGGFLLVTPTTTASVAQTTFWGLTVPFGQATGSYSGINRFTALYVAN